MEPNFDHDSHKELNMDALEKCNEQPSRVLHLRPLPYDIAEGKLNVLLSAYGDVEKIFIMRNLSLGTQALVQMPSIDKATEMICALNSIPLHIEESSERVEAQYSKSQRIRSPTAKESTQDLSNNDHRILLITVQDPRHQITTSVLHKVFSPFGIVQKIVIFIKSVGLQALVQFEGPSSAAAAKRSLNGQCIYSGCCTLIINYSKLEELTVHENGLRTRDFLRDDLPAPEIDSPVDPVQGDFGRAQQPPPAPNDPSKATTYDQTDALPADLRAQFGEPSLSSTTSAEHCRAGSPVVLICNLDDDKVTCDALFNLGSCYGNVLRIKKLYSKPGHALVQMEDHDGALTLMSHLRGFRLFQKSLNIRLSKHWYITNGPSDRKISDSGFREYGRSHNRFIGKFEKNTKYICSPTKTIHVSNLGELITEEILTGHLNSLSTEPFVASKLFNCNGHVQALIRYSSVEAATDTLALTHNTCLNDKSIKVAFSRNTI